MHAEPDSAEAQAIFALERPHPNLLLYYVLFSLLLGPFFFFALVPLVFRYRTLRYRFDQEGVSQRWGMLFRREVSLTYSRIQDIHLASNAVERWLGLARVQIQTASGGAGAEMTVEGLQEFEAIRDFLYSRMRGARDRDGRAPAAASSSPVRPGELAEVVGALRSVAQELAQLRSELAERDAP